MKGKILFTEVQHFRNTWIWYLVISVSSLIIIIMGQGMVKQLIMGEPWGDKPMPDYGLMLVSTISIAFVLGILYFIYSHKLTLQVDGGGLQYKFQPYFSSFRQVVKSDLKSLYVRKYSPIGEYGGWGYRFGSRRSKAFNIKGNRGLQLEFANGKKLLIGTQKPGELENAISILKQHWNMD